MEIQKAREKKDALEDAIEKLLKEFEESTGLKITSIDITRSDFSSFENLNQKPIHYIIINTEL